MEYCQHEMLMVKLERKERILTAVIVVIELFILASNTAWILCTGI